MPDAIGKLIVRLQGAPVAELQLAQTPITIGSAVGNNLVLPDAKVSPLHAQIDSGPDGPILTDRRSTHGTWVDGEPSFLKRPFLLRDGIVFRIGPFELTYQAMEATAPPPVHAAPSALPDPPEVASTPPAPPVPQPVAQPRLAGLSRYLDDLPAIFQPQGEGSDETFLGRYLLIFEAIWEPLEQRQDHIEHYFDPHTCPAAFLPWLARWLDTPLDRRLPEGRARALLSRAMEFHRSRGTLHGMADVIEVCTGLRPEISEDAEQSLFHVRLPQEAMVYQALVDDLISVYKPAHAGYTLEVQL